MEKKEIDSSYIITRVTGKSSDLKLQYSDDGQTNWHDTFIDGLDVYMRTSIDNGKTWSKEMRIVGEDGKDGNANPFIESSVSSVGFSVNADGSVLINQSIDIRINVIQHGKELDFIFGDLDSAFPPEFSYKVNGKKITITASPGNRISKIYNIAIPVAFKEIKKSYIYHESPNYGETLLDKSVYTKVYYELQHSQPEDWELNYATYYTSDNGTPILNTSSEWIPDVYYKRITEAAYGYIEYQDYSAVQYCNITIQGVIGGSHLPACSTLEQVTVLTQNKLIIGDYFTWLGETVASELVEDGRFIQRCNYVYIGGDNTYKWRKDTSSEHIAATLPDVINGALNELDIAENEQADNYFKKIFGSEIVSKRLIAETGLIGEIFSNQITISGKGKELGWIQGFNSKNELGFKLDSNGHAVLNDAEVKGNITAESLTIKSGESYKSFNDVINGYKFVTETALSNKNYSTKTDIGSNIVRQQAIYKVVNITLGSKVSDPNVPTNYVVANDNSGWVLSKPSVTDKQALYSCTQYQTYEQYSNRGSTSGVANCTTPSLFGETIIDTASGYIKTNLIKVDTLLADYVKTDELEANYIKTNEITSGKGVFTGLKADKAVFTNCTVTGEINATKGIFQGTVKQGLSTFNLFNIRFMWLDNKIRIFYSTLFVTGGSTITNTETQDKNGFTITKISTGIYKFAIPDAYLQNKFKAIWDDESWNHIQLIPIVRFASDVIVTKGDIKCGTALNSINARIKMGASHYPYINKLPELNSTDEALLEPLQTGIATNPVPASSWYHNMTTKKYEFYLILTDFNSDALEDPVGNIDMNVIAYFF